MSTSAALLDADVPPAVAAALAALLDADGLEAPFLPEELGAELAQVDATTFATGNWAPTADDLYSWSALVESLEGDGQPRFAVGLGGHGINSSAWTFALIAYGVAIAGQVGRGLAYANPVATASRWRTLQHGARRLFDAASLAELPADLRLVVQWNPLRDVAECTWHGPLPAEEPFQTELTHDDPDGEVFPIAIEALGRVARRG